MMWIYIVLGIFVVALFIASAVISLKYIRIVADNILNVPFPLDHPRTNTVVSQEVEFSSYDGTLFHGQFIACPSSSKKTVIFCHEYGSEQSSWSKYLFYLPQNGFNVFTFDFRKGKDRTGLHKKGFSPKQWPTKKELRDLQAAINYLQKRNDVDAENLGVFGVSKGGGLALCAGAKSKRVRAVIADGACPVVATIKDYIDKWANIYIYEPVLKRLPQFILYSLAYFSIHFASFRLRSRILFVENYIKRSKSPVFIIHGEKDSYIRSAHANYLYDRVPTEKDVWVCSGAAHNESVVTEPEEYQKRVLSFFQKHLNEENLEPSYSKKE